MDNSRRENKENVLREQGLAPVPLSMLQNPFLSLPGCLQLALAPWKFSFLRKSQGTSEMENLDPIQQKHSNVLWMAGLQPRPNITFVKIP